MKILFLHGWTSVPGGRKPTFLADCGHTVLNPALPDDDFDEAVRIAQAEFDRGRPDVVVGSSRGGAVAMNLTTGKTPMVLLCPAWKKWGAARNVKGNTTILHATKDDVVPFRDSVELVANSGLHASALIEVGSDHRLADLEPLGKMRDACLASRPRVAGCDFAAPKKSGDQAKKLIFIEAVRLGERQYAIEPTGRNARLVRPLTRGGPWKQNRPGWTHPDLLESLSGDRSIKAAAFDFPFSIPLTLLENRGFARRFNREPFRCRDRWVEFVRERLTLEFDGENAGASMESLSRFEEWKDKCFWIQRCTDKATNGSPPLKHKFQNVFAMTLAGVSLLSRLGATGYSTILDDSCVTSEQSLFETYPREVAKRIGFVGSYKGQPEACLTRALEFMEIQGIELEFDERVRDFCEKYRTSKTDPDGADAFLCLVSAICFYEGRAEFISNDADTVTLREEGAIIVPRAP